MSRPESIASPAAELDRPGPALAVSRPFEAEQTPLLGGRQEHRQPSVLS
jgi:hypothetical protein